MIYLSLIAGPPLARDTLPHSKFVRLRLPGGPGNAARVSTGCAGRRSRLPVKRAASPPSLRGLEPWCGPGTKQIGNNSADEVRAGSVQSDTAGDLPCSKLRVSTKFVPWDCRQLAEGELRCSWIFRRGVTRSCSADLPRSRPSFSCLPAVKRIGRCAWPLWKGRSEENLAGVVKT